MTFSLNNIFLTHVLEEKSSAFPPYFASIMLVDKVEWKETMNKFWTLGNTVVYKM